MKKLFLVTAISIGLMSTAQAYPHRHHHHYYHIIPPAFSTKSYLIADIDGQILKEQDSDRIRPIASISKLMLGLLVADQDLDELLTIPKTRSVQSKIPYKTETLSRKELLTFALVRSDNFAAQILCINLPNCVEKMNAKAVELGMWDTHYVEPTGLSRENVSTAHDLMKLLMEASTHPILSEITSQPNADISIGKHIIRINNTNPLTSKFKILLSKTGFTLPAGGCLAMIIDSSVGQRIMIILGSKTGHSRIPDMEKLISGL